MDLPVELRSPRKGLINIKSKDQKCILWCHVRHINPSKEHPERIKKTDKKIAEKLDYDRIEFPVQEKDFGKIEVKNNICINVFGYENGLVFPIYVSDQKFEHSMDLLLLIDDDKSLYVYIKDFDRFMFHKTRNKNRKWFCKSCLQCFSRESVLIKHKENHFSINGKQSVKLKKGIHEFENDFKQISVPFKIYAGFECNLRGVESYECSYTKKNIKVTFLAVLLTNLFCVDDRFTRPIVFYRDENSAHEFIKVILKDDKHFRKVMNKHFNKNLIMSEEEEHLFQQSNSCWICKKLLDNDEEKVRHHCHGTGKFTGKAHWNSNINFQLTKKVPVIFHNLRGYDSHLILNEFDKFDVKISIIPNGFEKYMAFF